MPIDGYFRWLQGHLVDHRFVGRTKKSPHIASELPSLKNSNRKMARRGCYVSQLTEKTTLKSKWHNVFLQRGRNQLAWTWRQGEWMKWIKWKVIKSQNTKPHKFQLSWGDFWEVGKMRMCNNDQMFNLLKAYNLYFHCEWPPHRQWKQTCQLKHCLHVPQLFCWM